MLLETEFRNLDDILHKEKQIYTQFTIGEVKTVPKIFYCDWLAENTAEQRKFKTDVKKRYPNCCHNHWYGLPTLKFEDESVSDPMPLNDYEGRMLSKYLSTNYYAQCKCRGAGASEIKTVRWNSFKYSTITNLGRKCLIVAGVNQELATVFLHRVKELMDKHPEVYLFPPKSDYPTEIFFKQGGSMWALPAMPNIVRSLENVGDVDYEEAGFWKLNDDKPVLKAGEPHVTKSKAHVNHLTTPNGRRGYLWNDIFDPDLGTIKPATKYLKHVINWREVVGIPEPDPTALSDFDMKDPNTRAQLKKTYLHRYAKDKEYKTWFDTFFPGRDINEILNVTAPILDVKEIVNLFLHDRPTYDQELDNQFILTENKAFGKFAVSENVIPIDFSPSDFE